MRIAPQDIQSSVNVKIDQTGGTSRRASARAAILDAAEAVVADVGAKHMTLEAVARRAAVSKGGLLYHFPSKETLLAAIIERHVTRLSEGGAALDNEGPSAGEIVAKLIRCRCDAASANRKGLRTAHGLLAAVAERPSLLDPMRAYNDELWARLKKSEGSEQALIAWLAFEGLLLMEIFHTSPVSDEERPRVIEALLGFLAQTEPPPKSLP
jgi:AcrR family transcriptional regulator